MFADINRFDTDHKFDGESGESTEGPDGKNKQQVKTVVQTILYGCQRLNRQVCFIVKYYLHLKHKTERPTNANSTIQSCNTCSLRLLGLLPCML